MVLTLLKHAWLGESSTALGSMLFILIWAGFGWGLLFYYAGLKGIPEDLYEAAGLDGASGLKLHLRITVPLLSPVITVQVTLAMITALKQMELVFLTTNGGPGDSTQFLAVYLYNKAFSSKPIRLCECDLYSIHHHMLARDVSQQQIYSQRRDGILRGLQL